MKLKGIPGPEGPVEGSLEGRPKEGSNILLGVEEMTRAATIFQEVARDQLLAAQKMEKAVEGLASIMFRLEQAVRDLDIAMIKGARRNAKG